MEVPDYGPYAGRDWGVSQKGHAAMITRLDRDVGRILERLDGLGLAENTVVFFTSDNGPHREGGADPDFFKSAGPLRGIKRDLYEGGIRVPAIVRWPGTVPAGSVSDHVWAFWDFLPTAAELAGVKAPRGIDGISLLPTLTQKPEAQVKHEYLYWEFHEGDFKQAVRVGDWKAVRSRKQGRTELFDLNADIGETTDLGPLHPERLRELENILDRARTPSEHWPT